MSNNQYSKKEIKNKINELFADNEEQAITASDLRAITRDYMAGSASSPILIYSGRWTAKLKSKLYYYSTGNNPPASYYGDEIVYDQEIRDTYIDTDFFRKHNPDKPTSTSNLWSVDKTGVPGADDGIVYVKPDRADPKMTIIKLTIKSNVISKLEIENQGGYHRKGTTYQTAIAGTSIVLTYNSVITHGGSSDVRQSFTLTTNPNRREGEVNHSPMKTVVQVTPNAYGTGDNFHGSISEDNKVQFWGGTYTETDLVSTGLKGRKKYKRTTFPGSATVTIWRIPRFN